MKLLSLAIITLASASAFAAKSNTQYYFQPGASNHVVEANYLMDVKPAKTETAGVETDAKQEMSDIYLNYTYGMSDNHAIGLETFFGNNKTTTGTTSSTASGMGDIHVYYKGFSEIWHYGADLGFNTEKIKLDATTGAIDNRSTGGMSFKANVGVMVNNAAMNYGADLSYLMPLERKVDNAAGTTLTGGNTLKLAPFLEYNWGMGFLGAELSYNMMDDTKMDTSGVETTFKGESYAGFLLYGTYDFNEMFTGILDLGMNMHPEHEETNVAGTKVKAYTETIVNIGLRMTF
ncbi:hypothetical protein [Bdellovibrio sp. HCB337]|uniref:hypothetical protein n=1 Tax=Bdellovibrio sp. HCB337 TaxID=3394358 RepID=UPI0039A69E70